jgi:hypothetical protein
MYSTFVATLGEAHMSTFSVAELISTQGLYSCIRFGQNFQINAAIPGYFSVVDQEMFVSMGVTFES